MSTLACYQLVDLYANWLKERVKPDNFPQKKHNLLQAMLIEPAAWSKRDEYSDKLAA